MPSDMAMSDPRPRIIGLESHGEEAISGQSGDITSGWVIEVECCGVDIEHAGFLGYDREVVAVEVDRVRDTDAC